MKLLAPVVALLSGCTSGDGLPWPPSQPPILQPPFTPPPPDLSPGSLPDLAAPPDLLPPPPTISFEIAGFTGSDISGDTNLVSLPLPTPTTVPIDGIDYVYRGFTDGDYAMTLEWADKTANNRGWTASFGGFPGAKNWPLVSRTFKMQAGATEFGVDKVALLGVAGAQPNTLVITIRSVSDPATNYGILRQGIAGK